VVGVNTVVVWYLIGALIGISVVLLVAEAIPSFKAANKRVNDDIRFLRSLPPGVERKDEQ
jgi:hypothetical protein